ncbi:MAG: 2OG-Fe(II) oxygenase [Gammaproteobacteria bacterium]
MNAGARAPVATAASALDRDDLGAALDERGFARIPGLLDEATCTALAATYDEEDQFRSRVVMARHNFGRGEYCYFAYPLPPPIARLRAALYPPLAAIANTWAARLGLSRTYPATLEAYLAHCHAAGQQRPTPLLLRYGAGDYNCLHRDLYGEEVFPLQVAILLSAPGRDFSGGEFVLTEQRPRMQSRVSVVALGQGDAVVFAVDARPVRGTRGDYRVQLRHGVSEVTAGHRHVLGLIFHDAT